MSHRSTRRRRTRALIGVTAVVGMIGAASTISAAAGSTPATNQLPRNGTSLSSPDSATGVPANVLLLDVKRSLLGTHTWYQQVLGGHPVVGGLYAIHRDTTGPTAGQVRVWDGRVKTGPLAATNATVSMASAVRAATAATAGRPLTYVAPSLWVLPGAAAHLVWKVSTVAHKGAYVSYVDATTGAVLQTHLESQNDSANKSKYVTGKARVFDPNPVVKLQNESLTDDNDANSAVPKSAYTIRKLQHLDRSHTLVGEWAKVVNSNLAGSPDDMYMWRRANDKFEQVMAYYELDTEESYYQSLGFNDVNAEPQKIQADAMADDNSWYIPSQDLIQTGTGGVDDAEDPEVVWHEDGHATQDDQVPGFGRTEEAGAIGEGFGDYMAVTMGQRFGKDTKLTPTTCVMDWDSTSYTPPPKHCLRTTDTTKMYPQDLDGEVHDDGEIWSHALWNMNVALGRDEATTAIVEGQFDFNPSINMPDAAKAIVAAAQKLYGDSAAAKTRRAFEDRGIL